MKDRNAIETIIQQAMRQGDFDNLPGQGQPFEWDPDEFSDDDWALAHHLLKQNGFAPEFIEMRQSIEADLKAARAELRRACDWRKRADEEGQPQDFVRPEFERAQARYRETISDLNRRIRDYNLIIPGDQFYRAPIKKA